MNDANAKTTLNNDNKIKHKITVQGKDIYYFDTKQTLLECLEISNIDIHYHCRDGYCGACRVTLNNGEIYYPNGDPLAYIGEKEILPCCCIPKSDISLTID